MLLPFCYPIRFGSSVVQQVEQRFPNSVTAVSAGDPPVLRRSIIFEDFGGSVYRMAFHFMRCYRNEVFELDKLSQITLIRKLYFPYQCSGFDVIS